MSHRIFIVEDHPIMQESLLLYLETEPDLEVCGVADTAEDALQQVFASEADLVIVDVSLPGMNGIELVRAIRAQQPELPCLVMSGHDEVRYAGMAEKVGAVGYVMKDSADAIVEAIRSALEGRERRA